MKLSLSLLKTLIDISVEKYKNIDTSLILKSLVYFDDIVREPIVYKESHNVDFEDVKEFLRGVVKRYYNI